MKIFKNILPARRKVRNALADILEKLDGSEKLDEVEQKLIAQAMKSVVDHYTGSVIPDKVYQSIAKEVTKAISKANKLLQKDLRSR